MRLSTGFVLVLPIGMALGGQIHTIDVGANGTLTYSPSSVNASAGDTLNFRFQTGNHTVTQSTFAAPCSAFEDASGNAGIDSGFQSVNSSEGAPEYGFNITDASTPLWFYCRQTGHCEEGMVFAVNAPASGKKSFAAFQAAAKKAIATSVNASDASSVVSQTTSSTNSSTSSTNSSTLIHSSSYYSSSSPTNTSSPSSVMSMMTIAASSSASTPSTSSVSRASSPLPLSSSRTPTSSASSASQSKTSGAGLLHLNGATLTLAAVALLLALTI